MTIEKDQPHPGLNPDGAVEHEVDSNLPGPGSPGKQNEVSESTRFKWLNDELIQKGYDPDSLDRPLTPYELDDIRYSLSSLSIGFFEELVGRGAFGDHAMLDEAGLKEHKHERSRRQVLRQIQNLGIGVDVDRNRPRDLVLSAEEVETIRSAFVGELHIPNAHWFEVFLRDGTYQAPAELIISEEDQRNANEQARLRFEVEQTKFKERAKRQAQRELNAEELAAARGPRTKRTGEQFAEIPPPPVVMNSVLAAEMNILGGHSEAGKSLLAREWALAVASGQPWRGFPVTEQRNVLWIASEGLHDFAQRFTTQPGWHEAKSRLFILDETVDLVTGDDVDWLLREYADERPGLVIFDVIYGMGMGDDTGTKDVFPVINALKRISAEWQAATLALGHPGHNADQRRFRGSSAWRQLTYTEWHMSNDVVTCEKSKIADKSRFNMGYRVEYPNIQWGSAMVIQAQTYHERVALVRADLLEFPDQSDNARANRLMAALGLAQRATRTLIKTVREDPNA